MKHRLNGIPRYYAIIFLVYLVLVVYLSKDAKLVFEWKDIIYNFQNGFEYRYKGTYTAYMPPLYPYYLLFFKILVGGSYWIWISCIVQSLVFFFAVSIAFRNFFGNKWPYSKQLAALFCVIIFFPPILFGVTKVSSFAFACSCITLLLSELYSFRFTVRKSIFIALLLVAGIYVRYEFWLIGFLFSVILFVFKKISLRHLALFPLVIFIFYSPWCYRNYIKLGKFTYSTSSEYNFAKGNNLNYNVFSSYNLPFDPSTKKILTDDFLYETYTNEVQKENYLERLNKDFISTHFPEFIRLNIKKLAINLFQFFPDNNYFNNQYFPYLYSLICLAITFLYFRALIILYTGGRHFAFWYGLGVYLFFIFIYSVAPLPRYFLFFLPFFIMIIGKGILLRRSTKIHKE